MICHATGTTPSREYPRRNFVSLLTPLGVLSFRDKATMQTWIDRLPEKMKTLLAEHKAHETPGAIFLSGEM